MFLREDVPPDYKLRQRKSKSSPMDECSSAGASDSLPGPLQTQDPIATLSDSCILNSLPVPQVPSDPSRYGDDISFRRSHSPALQGSSSSHSATLIVGDCSSSLPLLNHQQLFRIRKLVMIAPFQLLKNILILLIYALYRNIGCIKII